MAVMTVDSEIGTNSSKKHSGVKYVSERCYSRLQIKKQSNLSSQLVTSQFHPLLIHIIFSLSHTLTHTEPVSFWLAEQGTIG